MIRLWIWRHHKYWTIHVLTETIFQILNILGAIQNLVQTNLANVIVMSRVHKRLGMLDATWR